MKNKKNKTKMFLKLLLLFNLGISFIAALLLLFMEEEDAFWVLHVLTTSPKVT